MKYIFKITQILFLVGIFIPIFWVYTHPIILLYIPFTILFIHSEFFEQFRMDGNHYYHYISMKILKSPKKVKYLPNGKNYWIDILDRKEDQVIIYKRFLFFWIRVYKLSFSPPMRGQNYLDKLESGISNVIKSFENYKERKKTSKKTIVSYMDDWDGIIGSESEKKVYYRESRFSKLLDK